MDYDIVMISGKAGAGKTTTADRLEVEAKRVGYGMVYRMKFADVLYMLHDTLLNVMEDLTGKPRVKKDGKLLQLLGTEWGRTQYGPNVWSDMVKKTIDKVTAEFLAKNSAGRILFIIDDCRFENEFNAFPEALRVRLTASEEVRKARADAWRDDTKHPSEVGLDKHEKLGAFDLVIHTDDPASSPGHCATLIIAKLKRKEWHSRRDIWADKVSIASRAEVNEFLERPIQQDDGSLYGTIGTSVELKQFHVSVAIAVEKAMKRISRLERTLGVPDESK